MAFVAAVGFIHARGMRRYPRRERRKAAWPPADAPADAGLHLTKPNAPQVFRTGPCNPLENLDTGSRCLDNHRLILAAATARFRGGRPPFRASRVGEVIAVKRGVRMAL